MQHAAEQFYLLLQGPVLRWLHREQRVACLSFTLHVYNKVMEHGMRSACSHFKSSRHTDLGSCIECIHLPYVLRL